MMFVNGQRRVPLASFNRCSRSGVNSPGPSLGRYSKWSGADYAPMEAGEA